MNMQRKTISNGRTGFWMRVERDLSVRVVNGTMYKLLNAKKGYTLTRIYSLPFARLILLRRVKSVSFQGRALLNKCSENKVLGLIGLRVKWYVPALGTNTMFQSSKQRKEHLAMSQSTYSSQAFSRLIGLKDGSASDTVKAFQMRRNGRQQL